MMVYERSRFGRYYTKPAIGQALVDLTLSRRPTGLIDLGAGGGSLAIAAAKRWANLRLLTIDNDATSDQRVSKLLAAEEIRCHRHLSTDVLGPSLTKLVRREFGKFDSVVCNPPFTTPIWRKGFELILEDAGFSGCMPILADTDSALLFLSQALRLLGTGSTLGIILPDSLVSGTKYRRFRQELLSRYRVDAVVRLPARSFMHTDAVAHIVIVRKGLGGSSSVPLRKFDGETVLPQVIVVDATQAVSRMDFDFHSISSKGLSVPNAPVVLPLGEIALGVHRGSLQATASRRAGIRVLHTTGISDSLCGKWISLQAERVAVSDRCILAEPGDILVARVGRNLEQKVVGVQSGSALLTDCVYRVRMPFTLAGQTLRQLSSEFGRAWLASRSSGVGAKHLRIADLLSFPLCLSE